MNKDPPHHEIQRTARMVEAEHRVLRIVRRVASQSSAMRDPLFKFRNSDLIEISISLYGSASSINVPFSIRLSIRPN